MFVRILFCGFWLILAFQGLGQQPILESTAIALDTIPQDSSIATSPLSVPDSTEIGIFSSDSLVALSLSQIDSTRQDTSVVVQKKPWTFRGKDFPNPNKAIIYGLILPGAGQAYNKQWLKIPIAYALIGATGYYVLNRQKEYVRYRDAVLSELKGEPHPFSGQLQVQELRTIRNRLNNQRQTAYIIFFGSYVIQAADAFVSAHLKTFDVSDDLSMSIGVKGLGMGMVWRF